MRWERPFLAYGVTFALLGVACGSEDRAQAPAARDVDPAGGGAAGRASAGAGMAGDRTSPDLPPALSREERQLLLDLSPVDWPAPPPDVTNRYADDPAAARLGKKLFDETELAGPLLDADNDGGPSSLGNRGDVGKVSCASCHVPDHGFSDTRSFQLQISLGSGWGRRRAPSLLNVGHAKLVTWDGRRDALYNQVFAPLESVVEMNTSRLFVARKIFEKYSAEYEAVFGPLPPLGDAQRFPPLSAELTGCQPLRSSDPQPTCDGTFHGYPGDGAEYDRMTEEDQESVTRVVVNMGKAIGAFQRYLSCGAGTFDAWMRGDDSAISPAAQRGAQLFVGKARCVTCHSGPFLSDNLFHNVGLRPDTVQQAFIDLDDRGAAVGIAEALEDPLNSRGAFSDGDDGRLPVAVPEGAEGAFRTPMLRCVSGRPTFMHTGQIYTLQKVVEFFDKAGNQSGYSGSNELHALDLSARERSDLVEFLRALDGPLVVAPPSAN